VRDEDAVLGLDRREHRVVEREVGAAPQVEPPTRLDAAAEGALLAGGAADAVGGDHDLGVEIGDGAPGAELQLDTGLLGVALQDREQLGARDADEAVVVHARDVVADAHRHVVPVPGGDDLAQRVGIGSLQLALRPGGQPDPETERGVGLALLVHGDHARRVRELQQACGVEPAGPAPQHRDPSHLHPDLLVRRTLTTIAYVE
jgi:hypothetical protein